LAIFYNLKSHILVLVQNAKTHQKRKNAATVAWVIKYKQILPRQYYFYKKAIR